MISNCHRWNPILHILVKNALQLLPLQSDHRSFLNHQLKQSPEQLYLDSVSTQIEYGVVSGYYCF